MKVATWSYKCLTFDAKIGLLSNSFLTINKEQQKQSISTEITGSYFRPLIDTLSYKTFVDSKRPAFEKQKDTDEEVRFITFPRPVFELHCFDVPVMSDDEVVWLLLHFENKALLAACKLTGDLLF